MNQQPQKHDHDFDLVFAKLTELEQQAPQGQDTEQMSDVEIREYDEIRALREMVMEVETKPQVYFSTT